MKWIILLLSCLSCYAQFPYCGTTWNVGSSVFDPTNYANLFIELFTDNSTCVTNTVDGSAIQSWFNLKKIYNSDNDRFRAFADSGANGPVLKKNAGPLSQTVFDFGSAVAGACIEAPASFGTNQPTTLFVIFKSNSDPVAGQVLTDSLSGGRNQIAWTTTFSQIYAGANLQATPSTIKSGIWTLFSAEYNGANSYFRTNGVAVIAGNPSTQGIGQFDIGNDASRTVPFKGYVYAVLAYGQAMNTNDLQAVEAGLRARAGF